ncbi:MAG: hypothetical protein A3K50_02250 [Planctomycetes bacterium RIFOXYD12_FULL_42_12]|nr:MAG: hypothetical protein A2351_06260 [Omnitrophica bacterium RIFOXYB12_FULL_50_7]OHC07104.1 MAG: hypothetical protein A3K50_02250 [Planctomycetes bacterium RIFOXYD12_FULL_42_12]
MTNDIAIEFKNVFEKYDIEILLDGKSSRESFEALRDISFAVRKGESVAIIGPNGAGKSTILRLIAGLLRPEKGEVRVHGRVGSLLDLGAGFHPELTGRDNLLLNASLYNFSREELDSKYNQILEFADIGKFINAPVRCYSQGMYVRLAFSLAIHVDPDILLIDDCLSVGDDNFRAKSLDKALELKAKNKTIVFVTHDFTLARLMCKRGIYVRESRMIVDTDIDTAVSRYLEPLEADRDHFKYLSAKISEEEKKEQKCVLFCGPFLKFIISPAKVQIFHRDCELTSHNGVRAHFTMGGQDISSDSAVWRVKKISDEEVVCFLRWTQPQALFQAWYFKSLGDGTVELEIMMRPRAFLPTENAMMEFCLKTPCEILDGKRWGNKAKVFSCDSGAGLRIETLQEDQICGISTEGKEFFRPYFLRVPEGPSGREIKTRSVYFKGRFSSGSKTVAIEDPVLASHKLEAGRTKVDFREGSCQLSWDGKLLTTGLGIYTSLYSKGTWYDSAQARWKVKESSPDRLKVEGFWPWIPVAQVWEILLKDEKTVFLSAKMKVWKEMPIHMQETVMMLSAEYEKWSAGKEVKEFPEGFTSDDFFRFCLWANEADGASGLSSHSDHLPTVTFKPAAMQGYRVIVENSAHIYDVRARLFHCLCVNKNEETYFAPGEYEYFKGMIYIKEGSV